VVNDALGALRIKLGHDRKLLQGEWQRCGGGLPDVRLRRRGQALRALHHPFTAPKIQDAETIDLDPANALSRAYDMVLNGSEIGGVPSASTARTSSRRCSACSASMRPRSARVRLPAGRAQVRRAAARRHRLRHRPHQRAHGRHRLDPT